MRVMLEVAHRDRAPAYLMTSSAPGEGKTGLTAALALSYALSGSRTLVIDADLMGRGLTSGHNADNEPGLCEALIEGSLSGFVRETTTAGLWLLPAGQTGGDGAARLSAIPVQRLLDEARQSFDVILIDSGPILGSVEASVISQKVDGVVFVVSRGQQRPLVRRALAQLRIVSAKMAGVVFNRADSQEFSRVAYMSSMRTRPNQGAAGMTSDALAHATKAPASKPTAATAKPSVNSRRGPMGPLVQSVDNLSAVESA
jgi:capsular exopolysaccharide synthesis family protein